MQTKVITSLTEENLEGELSFAANVIRTGGLVVFPTETVYGLGGDATNPSAAKRIYAAKGRPSDNPLIIHVASPEEAERYAYTNEVYYKLAKRFMPGPLTVVLKAKDTVPVETRGGLDTVAVRCPSNPIAKKLISLSGVPIAAPSANLSGSPSPTELSHVLDDMMGRVDVIIDGGESDIGLESTIVSCVDTSEPTLLRPGKITAEDLVDFFGAIKIADAVTDKLREGEIALSPGMKYKHYAPRGELVLIDANPDAMLDYVRHNITEKTAVISYDEQCSEYLKMLPEDFVFCFGRKDDYDAHSFRLFSFLRDADKLGCERIFAPLPKKDGLGLALYNRMIRAAAHKIIKL